MEMLLNVYQICNLESLKIFSAGDINEKTPEISGVFLFKLQFF